MRHADQYLDKYLNLPRLYWNGEKAMTSNPSRVVIAAPMSFAGSAGRTINLFWHDKPPVVKFGIGLWAVPLTLVIWWMVIVVWYFIFGILLVPFRLLRRGARKRKREARMHQQTLDAIRDAGLQK